MENLTTFIIFVILIITTLLIKKAICPAETKEDTENDNYFDNPPKIIFYTLSLLLAIISYLVLFGIIALCNLVAIKVLNYL